MLYIGTIVQKNRIPKMNLKTKLTSAFSIITLLIVIVGMVCIYTTTIINQSFGNVINESIPKLEVLRQIKQTVSRIQMEALSIGLINIEIFHHVREISAEYYGNEKVNNFKEQVEEEIEEFHTLEQDILDLLNEYKELTTTSEEFSISGRLADAVNLLGKNNHDFIEMSLEKEESNLLEKKEILEESENLVYSTIEEAIEIATKEVSKNQAIADMRANQAFIINSTVVVLAFFLTWLFGFIVIRSIIIPINRLQLFAQGLAKGDWKQIDFPTQQDELGKLALVFNEMAKQLRFAFNTLETRNTTLVKLNQEKNEFLGIVAHDLKNPLFAILGLSEEILESFDNLSKEEVIEYTKIIQDSSHKMFQLIVNLLDVNAIESGKINITLEEVDLFPITQQLVKEYLERANNKNIQLHFNPNEEHFVILADKGTVHQILDNLISNAIKYSPHGKNVHIRLKHSQNIVKCEVQDEGLGLSPEDQEKLFLKFSRLTPKPTGDEHSTGLGLFSVKKLTEMMNGKVSCKSELNKGSVFTVEFNGI